MLRKALNADSMFCSNVKIAGDRGVDRDLLVP